jgi:peptide/nickel transport system ATP-binding protein
MLRGELPSPINPPTGCAFHPRCPQVMDICRTTAPEIRDLGTCKVACHAVQEQGFF